MEKRKPAFVGLREWSQLGPEPATRPGAIQALHGFSSTFETNRRISDETQSGATFAHAVRLALRLDPVLLQPRERVVEIVDGERNVTVPAAQLVRAASGVLVQTPV